MSETIPTREREAAIQSLRSGVVPRLGIRHIQVGRIAEVKAMLSDVSTIAAGGSAFRFVIAPYGAGKSFLLSVTKAVAHEQKLVTLSADLSPDRRLHASAGQARLLCAELIKNMATRTSPDGNALQSVVQRFIAEAKKEAELKRISVKEAILGKLEPIQDLISGNDFAIVIVKYYDAYEAGDEVTKANAIRWLRCEYSIKTPAREDLQVRTIVNDIGIIDHLKALSCLVRLAGYGGMLIMLDEMVNLYKLTNSQARSANYEMLLRMLNDCLQGNVAHTGFIFGGTPEFLTDPHRGLFSYEALRSRLAENSFAKDDIIDLSGPVIRLKALTPEELYVLLGKLRHLYAGGDPQKYLVPDEALESFLVHCSKKIGESYFRTPRHTIKAFLDLLAVLDQNPAYKWSDLIEKLEIEHEALPSIADMEDNGGPDLSRGDGDNDLATFRL